MNVGAKFDRFVSNIQLTDAQKEDAATKHVGVRKTLHDCYYATAYTGSTSILVGSYGKHTAVRPPADIDILFIMPDSKFEYYDKWGWNGQSALLQDVKNVLLKKYQNTDIRGDGQVVSVPFVSFAVEVVPVFSCYSLTGTNLGQYYTPDTHSGGSWKYTNPSAEKAYISTSNANSNGNTVHLIKMMKVWKRYCNVPIKSLAIELLAVTFIDGWANKGRTSIFYDWMVRDFFKYMLSRKNGYEAIPGIPELLSLGDAWCSKAESALGRAEKAVEYDASSSDIDNILANWEWQKIFGDMFQG